MGEVVNVASKAVGPQQSGRAYAPRMGGDTTAQCQAVQKQRTAREGFARPIPQVERQQSSPTSDTLTHTA